MVCLFVYYLIIGTMENEVGESQLGELCRQTEITVIKSNHL